MKHLIPFLLTLTLLVACAPSLDEPVSSDDPMTQTADDILPSPADSALTRESVYLDSIDLLTMESYPLQFSLALAGNMPTPCNQLRVDVSPPNAENQILVDVYSLSTPGTICTEVLQPFSQNVPLGSFPAGHYTVWVNGEQVAEFDS
jgi:hypothetical protein